MMLFNDLRSIVGQLAVGTTILQFLSGIIVCKEYVVKRSTAESSPLPFICGVISCVLWFFYGYVKKDNNIIFVNIVGVILMSLYTIVFFIYSSKKTNAGKQIFSMIAVLLFIQFYVYVEEDKERLFNHLGFLASFFTVLTIAAPMSKLFHVMRVKCTECLPFPMILMSFFVSIFWFAYSQIEKDIYLGVVNFIGGVLAVLQLSLFAIYPSKKSNNFQSPFIS